MASPWKIVTFTPSKPNKDGLLPKLLVTMMPKFAQLKSKRFENLSSLRQVRYFYFQRGKVVEFKVDEHPKPKTTIESMGKLGPVFKKGGTVNAGNASGICDGAASLILASAEACKVNDIVFSYSSIYDGILGQQLDPTCPCCWFCFCWL